MYRRVIKPVLFSLTIEQAHHAVLLLLRIIGLIPGGRWLLRKCYAVEHPALEREVFGIRFANPIGLAAGFDHNGEAFRELAALGFGFVEVRDHVDGIFVKVREEFLRKTLHPAFGVTGSRGGVAVDGSEIALTFDQRGAHGERLRKTDERIVNCGIAVRVIFTHDFTDDSRRFDGRMSFGKPQLFHSVENSAVYGFEPVADIRDGPSDIDTQ